jgi:hypothetical protein
MVRSGRSGIRLRCSSEIEQKMGAGAPTDFSSWSGRVDFSLGGK